MIRVMITKPMESISNTDLMVANKLCRVLGCEPLKEPPGSSARRNLFGCLEDSSVEFLLRQADEMAQQSSELWNFDFLAERPIPGGRYAWEPVESNRVPTVYCDLSMDCGEKDNTQAVCSDIGETKCSEIKIKCNSSKSKWVQTSIKGYMPVQKRRRISNRLRSKGLPDTLFLSTCPRDYILSTAGSSKSS